MISPENIKDNVYESRLSQLLHLSRMLNSSLNLSEVLNLTMTSVVDFIKAERGFVMLFNDSGELEVKAYKNVDPNSIIQNKDISTTIINGATKEGKEVLSVNAQTDPRFKDKDSVMLTGMRSVVCVPLKVKNRIIGVVYLDNRIEEGMFDKGHLEMLSAFANQAAVAIDNAKLHENLIKSYDERFRLAQELHQQEKIRLASEEANRMKSEFVSIVSHELRSPLTIIKNYTTILHRDASLERNAISIDMKQEIYQTMDREVDRLISMINKLLDVSRIDAGKPMKPDYKDCDISKLLSEILKIQKTSKFHKETHHIVTQIPEDLPNLLCDQEKMSQILSNLIENALKYSPDGGEVVISVSVNAENMQFAIKDQGLGIKSENMPRLFKKYERFQETNRVTVPGTGLGLYLIKHLVELHGGTIKAESEPGKGSTFFFTIPIKKIID